MKLQGQVEIEQFGELLQLRAFVRELVETGPLRINKWPDLGPVLTHRCEGCGYGREIEEPIPHAEDCRRQRAIALLDDPDGEVVAPAPTETTR